MPLQRTEAETLAAQIREQTSLKTVVVDEGDDEYRIDIELPVQGEELRATACVNEADDWPWLYEHSVRPRLG